MKNIFTIAAMASIVLVGCQKNETANVFTSGSDYVSFDAYAGKTTRAALTTNDNFTLFTVYGYQGTNPSADIDWSSPKGLMSNLAVTKGDQNKWATASPVMWPAEDTKTQFFAFSPEGAANYAVTDSKPQLTFTANTVVAEQKDLVVAESDITVTPAKKTAKIVDLSFSHALSKISTKVNASSGLKVYIESLEMCNLGSIATYSFNPAQDNSWGTATTRANYSVTLNESATTGIASKADYTAITATDGATLVIPQNTTAWVIRDGKFSTATSSYIKINYKMQHTADDSYIVGAADAYVTAYFPVAFDFEANKAYSFNIMFGDTGGNTGGGGYDDNGDPIIGSDAFISFNVSFTDWVLATDSEVTL